MQTRRELLELAISVPLGMRFRATSGRPSFEIISEPNCLSEESAGGFRLLLANRTTHTERNTILLCGITALSKPRALNLRKRALGGSRILWENSPVTTDAQGFAIQKQVLKEVFGIAIENPIPVSSDRLYVAFGWPVSVLTRTFSAVIPVACPSGEEIAQYRGIRVAIKRRLGRGEIVFLGSMLGPNLRAEERETIEVVDRMLNLQE